MTQKEMTRHLNLVDPDDASHFKSTPSSQTKPGQVRQSEFDNWLSISSSEEREQIDSLHRIFLLRFPQTRI